MQRWLFQLQVSLLDGRTQNYLTSNPNRRSLWASGEWWNLNLEIHGRGRNARKAPPILELLRGERTDIKTADRHVALNDLHLALLAGAMAATG